MNITITQKDIEDLKLCNSASGMLIDELAYSIGEWTSDDLYENNLDYIPYEPYDYDYEADLFEATKTPEQFSGLVAKLCSPNLYISFTKEELGNMQAGAYCALKYPNEWETILKAYKDELQSNGTDGISEAYNKQLQKEQDEWNDDQYHEWLHGDYRDWDGIVRMIAKYYTEDRDNGEYTPYNDKTKDEASYTFEMDEEYLHEEYCGCGDTFETCTEKMDYKKQILSVIQAKSNARKEKDRIASEKRREERKKQAEYQAKRKAEDEAERIAKLKAMKIN